jgi:type II secretory pathway pseudopilin PulG
MESNPSKCCGCHFHECLCDKGAPLRRRRHASGITIVESIISLVIISMLAAAAFTALERANRYAMQSRLYTLAESLARDQVDRVLTVSPFNPQNPPWLGGPQVPSELVLDSARGGPVTRDVPLYIDPSTNAVLATARVTTSISNVGALNTRAARVRVSYSFAGKDHEVRMNTLRTSDSP